MSRTSKTYSVSLAIAIAEAVERSAQEDGLSPGLKIAEIVETHFLDKNNPYLPADAKADLLLLRQLRDEAIDKMHDNIAKDGFTADITLKTFNACQDDPEWLAGYERYIRGPAVVPGNPRKTNANQTIGSRIKSKLRANDLTDQSGKLQRGRAPVGSIIQTFQLLRIE